MESHQYL